MYIPVNPLPGVETNGLSDSRLPGLLLWEAAMFLATSCMRLLVDTHAAHACGYLQILGQCMHYATHAHGYNWKCIHCFTHAYLCLIKMVTWWYGYCRYLMTMNPVCCPCEPILVDNLQKHSTSSREQGCGNMPDAIRTTHSQPRVHDQTSTWLHQETQPYIMIHLTGLCAHHRSNSKVPWPWDKRRAGHRSHYMSYCSYYEMLMHSIQYSCLLDPHDFYRSSQRHKRWLTQALPAVGTVPSVDATSDGQKSGRSVKNAVGTVPSATGEWLC